MQVQTRIADSTQDEQEQRENQQRQLRVMASLRRRERELHRIRLETNARLEKIQGRIAEETNARRALLLEKFREEGLEKVSRVKFVALCCVEGVHYFFFCLLVLIAVVFVAWKELHLTSFSLSL